VTTALLFLAGLAGLVVGAGALVRGAARLALSLGLSPLVVGLTVVAFGTGAPEVAVSVDAALAGTTDIAVANVVGSNIANVLLILGLSALVTPLTVHVQLVRQEIPVMLGASLLLVGLAWDLHLSAAEGAGLLLLFATYTAFIVVQARRQSPIAAQEYTQELAPRPGAWDARRPVQLLLIVGGLALLVVGADAVVTAAVRVARALGVSDVVIGLTVVAIGTSLPEVATSLVAAFRGERDIAAGNVVGSNTFNILGCLGAAAVASGRHGLDVAPSLLRVDVWVMLAAALACLPVFTKARAIGRAKGGLFVLSFVLYLVWQVRAATAGT
jgi:cation:H+ antiporter